MRHLRRPRPGAASVPAAEQRALAAGFVRRLVVHGL